MMKELNDTKKLLALEQLKVGGEKNDTLLKAITEKLDTLNTFEKAFEENCRLTDTANATIATIADIAMEQQKLPNDDTLLSEKLDQAIDDFRAHESSVRTLEILELKKSLLSAKIAKIALPGNDKLTQMTNGEIEGHIIFLKNKIEFMEQAQKQTNTFSQKITVTQSLIDYFVKPKSDSKIYNKVMKHLKGKINQLKKEIKKSQPPDTSKPTTSGLMPAVLSTFNWFRRKRVEKPDQNSDNTGLLDNANLSTNTKISLMLVEMVKETDAFFAGTTSEYTFCGFTDPDNPESSWKPTIQVYTKNGAIENLSILINGLYNKLPKNTAEIATTAIQDAQKELIDKIQEQVFLESKTITPGGSSRTIPDKERGERTKNVPLEAKREFYEKFKAALEKIDTNSEKSNVDSIKEQIETALSEALRTMQQKSNRIKP
jgi:hypothetical protein